jgi:hypothetical protein
LDHPEIIVDPLFTGIHPGIPLPQNNT